MTELFNCLKPGDIINFKHPKIDISDLPMSIASYGVAEIISQDQKQVFCQRLPENKVERHHHHSELWLGETNCFTEEPPEAFWQTQTILDNDDGMIDVYRMNPEYFGRELIPDDIEIMRDISQKIINLHQPYSIGLLLDILGDTIAGYPEIEINKIFTPFDKNPLVCSVAIAAIIAGWRHERYKKTGEKIPQPFTTLNPDAWNSDFKKSWPGHWDIRRTPPAIFAVTKTHFQNEYIHRGSFHKGKQIA